MDWLNSLSPILLNGECIELQHNGVPYEGGEATPLYVIKCGWYTGGIWDTLVVRGCLGKAIANICIPLAIPSSMDVKRMVSFEIDSSEVLFDCSNGLIISSWWDLLWLPSQFSSYALYCCQPTRGYWREWPLPYNLFNRGVVQRFPVDWLALEESGDFKVYVSKFFNE